MSVEIFKRGDRGFHGYGREFKDSYGAGIEVYESSAASGPHVWLKIEQGPGMTTPPPGTDIAAHLNQEQAQALIDRLQAWIDEIPSRWERPSR